MNIKELRYQLEMSQQQFSELLGVTIATVWRWEHGVSEPSPSAKEKISGLLKNLKN